MKRVLVSFACGLILTAVLTGIGLALGSRNGVCVFIWQGCLAQLILQTADTPVEGGSDLAWYARYSLGCVAGRAHLLADKLWFSHSLCACLKEIKVVSKRIDQPLGVYLITIYDFLFVGLVPLLTFVLFLRRSDTELPFIETLVSVSLYFVVMGASVTSNK